jgi:hypothetical protein
MVAPISPTSSAVMTMPPQKPKAPPTLVAIL